MNRREFLSAAAAAAIPSGTQARAAEPKKIAAVITVYRPNSHADVIVGKYLEGYNQDGQAPRPESRVVAMYVAQTPEKDMSREMGRTHGVPIYRTIYEALTLGTDKLAVDGVLLIGEHGDYPVNDKLQTLYPRFEMFLEITDVFRRSGRAVPVFNDKHLSYSWIKARRMVEIARELKFPFMAGSSIPVTYRRPDLDLEWGAPARRAVAISYSGLDIYGFHLIESLQCMVERRRGGETGIRAVQCLQHAAVWEYLEKTAWAKRLFEEALARSLTRRQGDLRTLVKEPAVFLLDYRDGLQAAAFLLTGGVSDFTVAIDVEGASQPVSTLQWAENRRPYWHFACLVRNIERMFQTGIATYPVERTWLASAALDWLLESRIQGYKRLETPQLEIRYTVSKESVYCKGTPPRPYQATAA
jgi:hypothetical protein